MNLLDDDRPYADRGAHVVSMRRGEVTAINGDEDSQVVGEHLTWLAARGVDGAAASAIDDRPHLHIARRDAAAPPDLDSAGEPARRGSVPDRRCRRLEQTRRADETEVIRRMIGDDPAVDDLLRDGTVESMFQPVVDLDTAEVVGYEALSRGPSGRLRSPDALFAAARAVDRLTELDWLCRTTAITAARVAGVRFPLSVLINAEPETLLADRGDATRWGEFADLRCYCELTERALARDPGRLAAAVDQIRAQDWGVALDDVGVEPASMALLPLLQPDIIKLDASLLRPPTTPAGVDVAQVVHAALTQAAETGAAVIAEGIETDADRQLARAYGVAYGQGYLLGRPGTLPDVLPTTRRTMPLVPRILDRSIDPGPFAVLANAQPVRALPPAAVTELARQLLVQAATLVPAPAVLVASPVSLEGLNPGLLGLVAGLTREPRYVPVIGVLGHPQRGLAVSDLAPGDPARPDFAVAVVSAHFAAAVVARPNLNDPAVYDAALTLDRTTATAVANSMLTRLS